MPVAFVYSSAVRSHVESFALNAASSSRVVSLGPSAQTISCASPHDFGTVLLNEPSLQKQFNVISGGMRECEGLDATILEEDEAQRVPRVANVVALASSTAMPPTSQASCFPPPLGFSHTPLRTRTRQRARGRRRIIDHNVVEVGVVYYTTGGTTAIDLRARWVQEVLHVGATLLKRLPVMFMEGCHTVLVTGAYTYPRDRRVKPSTFNVNTHRSNKIASKHILVTSSL